MFNDSNCNWGDSTMRLMKTLGVNFFIKVTVVVGCLLPSVIVKINIKTNKRWLFKLSLARIWNICAFPWGFGNIYLTKTKQESTFSNDCSLSVYFFVFVIRRSAATYVGNSFPAFFSRSLFRHISASGAGKTLKALGKMSKSLGQTRLICAPDSSSWRLCLTCGFIFLGRFTMAQIEHGFCCQMLAGATADRLLSWALDRSRRLKVAFGLTTARLSSGTLAC